MKTILAIALLVAMLAVPAVLAAPGGVPNGHAISKTPEDPETWDFRSPVAAVTNSLPDNGIPGMGVNDLIQASLMDGSSPVNIVALLLSDPEMGFNANCQPPEVIPGEPPVI